MDEPKLSDRQKAYFQAAAEGKVEELRRFLGEGIPVDLPCSSMFMLGLLWDATALMYAAAHGQLEATRFLLGAGARVSAETKANQVDGGGRSQPLHFAVQSDRLAVVEELLNAGADPNAQGNWGRTPLALAATKGKLDAVKLLLKRGADVNFKSRRKADLSPLLAAIMGEKVPAAVKSDLITILVEAGADPNVVGDANQAPLNKLAAAGDIPNPMCFTLAELLLKAGAKVDHANKFGETPLQYAVYCKKAEVARLLIGHGANFNLIFRRGTALDIAENQLQMIQKDIADPRAPDKARQLLNEQLRETQQILKLLLEKGAKRKTELT